MVGDVFVAAMLLGTWLSPVSLLVFGTVLIMLASMTQQERNEQSSEKGARLQSPVRRRRCSERASVNTTGLMRGFYCLRAATLSLSTAV